MRQFLRRLQGVLVARTLRDDGLRLRVEQLEKAVALTPGLESPTVSPLHNEGWVAVRAMVPAKEAQRIMDDLYDTRRPRHPDHGHPRLPALRTGPPCPDDDQELPRRSPPGHLPAGPHPGRPADRRRRDLRGHHHGRAAAGEAQPGGERASFVFTGAAALRRARLLLSRPKVVADESGVTVVNLAGRAELAWAEILRVNLRPGDPWVFLDLSDGTSLPALGIQPGIAKQQRRSATPARCAPSPKPRSVRDPEDGRTRARRASRLTLGSHPAVRAHVLINLLAEAFRCASAPLTSAPGPQGPPATRGVTPSSDGRIVL